MCVDSTLLTSSLIGDRLRAEAEVNVALQVTQLGEVYEVRKGDWFRSFTWDSCLSRSACCIVCALWDEPHERTSLILCALQTQSLGARPR